MYNFYLYIVYLKDVKILNFGVNMDYVKGVVKKYYREYNRTLKDGTKKTYKTEQVQVTIPKNDNIFEDKEEVYILSIDEGDSLKNADDTIVAYELFNAILTEEKNESGEKLVENEIQFNSYEEEIASLKEEINHLNDTINQKDASISDLNEQLADKDDVSCDLNSEIEERDATIAELKSEITDKDACIFDLNRILEDKDAFIAKLNNQLDNKNFNISDLNKELDDKAVIIYDLNKKMDRLNQRHQSLINNIRSLDYALDDESDINVTTEEHRATTSFNNEDYIQLQKDFIELYEKFESSQARLYDEKITNIHYRNLINKFKSFVIKIE